MYLIIHLREIYLCCELDFHAPGIRSDLIIWAVKYFYARWVFTQLPTFYFREIPWSVRFRVYSTTLYSSWKMLRSILWKLALAALIYHEDEISDGIRPLNNGRTRSISRGNEVEIALSNAINCADYRRNFCCHVFVRARVCPRGNDWYSDDEIDGMPEETYPID